MTALAINSALGNVKTMLAGLTWWQGICSVDNATDAGKRIYIEGAEEIADDGTPIETLAPLIILDESDFSSEYLADRLHGDLTVEIRVILAIPGSECDSFATQRQWTWEQRDLLTDGINSNIQGGGELMARNLASAMKPSQVDPDTNNGRTEWAFILTVSVYLI